jgi:hypothetical protein
MRKLLHVFLLAFVVGCLLHNLNAQNTCTDACGGEVNAEKKSFNGKAPFAIDGQISDWEIILGQSTGDAFKPFVLPDTTAFNWAIDPDQAIGTNSPFCLCSSNEGTVCSIEENPIPMQPAQDQNIRLSALIHDDFNVFFYFRRLARTNSPNSFYYFCDVNADGHMKEGEPVFHATFTGNTITSLTLSRYIPNKTTDFILGKGNPLGREDEEQGKIYITVQDNPMYGTLEEVFNSNNIPSRHQLKKKELFDAAITEGGLGVELAIPWRYLSIWFVDKRIEKKLLDQLEDLFDHQWVNPWLDKWKDKLKRLLGNKWKNTRPLKSGDIFFYKLSMKQGGGQYSAADVVDHAGDFCGGVGRSGDVSFNTSISPPVFLPGTGYRIKLSYTNLTNATEIFGIERIILSNIQLEEAFEPSQEEANSSEAVVYKDKNCNGKIDPGENAAGTTIQEEFSKVESDSLHFLGDLEDTAAPFKKVCFIVDVVPYHLPSNNVIEIAEVNIQPAISFDPPSFCEVRDCIGRTIKRIGVASSSISTTTLLTIQKGSEVLEDTNSSGVLVYPNPTSGTISVYLLAKEGVADLILEDYLGKKVQQWNRFTSNSLQINNLNRGLYLLRVQYLKTGKVEMKKIIVH